MPGRCGICTRGPDTPPPPPASPVAASRRRSGAGRENGLTGCAGGPASMRPASRLGKRRVQPVPAASHPALEPPNRGPIRHRGFNYENAPGLAFSAPQARRTAGLMTPAHPHPRSPRVQPRSARPGARLGHSPPLACWPQFGRAGTFRTVVSISCALDAGVPPAAAQKHVRAIAEHSCTYLHNDPLCDTTEKRQRPSDRATAVGERERFRDFPAVGSGGRQRPVAAIKRQAIGKDQFRGAFSVNAAIEKCVLIAVVLTRFCAAEAGFITTATELYYAVELKRSEHRTVRQTRSVAHQKGEMVVMERRWPEGMPCDEMACEDAIKWRRRNAPTPGGEKSAYLRPAFCCWRALALRAAAPPGRTLFWGDGRGWHEERPAVQTAGLFVGWWGGGAESERWLAGERGDGADGDEGVGAARDGGERPGRQARGLEAGAARLAAGAVGVLVVGETGGLETAVKALAVRAVLRGPIVTSIILVVALVAAGLCFWGGAAPMATSVAEVELGHAVADGEEVGELDNGVHAGIPLAFADASSALSMSCKHRKHNAGLIQQCAHGYNS
ncbi:Protein of unknown function [Gryllus bimaculatus]|nr:Protein of unknown function [Gryllus bimaculatus]